MPCESVSFSDLEEGLELGLPRSCDASMKRDVGRGGGESRESSSLRGPHSDHHSASGESEALVRSLCLGSRGVSA